MFREENLLEGYCEHRAECQWSIELVAYVRNSNHSRCRGAASELPFVSFSSIKASRLMDLCYWLASIHPAFLLSILLYSHSIADEGNFRIIDPIFGMLHLWYFAITILFEEKKERKVNKKKKWGWWKYAKKKDEIFTAWI